MHFHKVNSFCFLPLHELHCGVFLYLLCDIISFHFDYFIKYFLNKRSSSSEAQVWRFSAKPVGLGVDVPFLEYTFVYR